MKNENQQYHECHVTMESKDIALVETHVKDIGWKFSCIDGDPILGDGIKCYATKHFPSKCDVNDVVNNVKAASEQLSMYGHKVIRDKVELVVYDSKLVKL